MRVDPADTVAGGDFADGDFDGVVEPACGFDVVTGPGDFLVTVATLSPVRAAASRKPDITRRATNSSSTPPTTSRRRLITRRLTRRRARVPFSGVGINRLPERWSGRCWRNTSSPKAIAGWRAT
jgi:hypothetical protein